MKYQDPLQTSGSELTFGDIQQSSIITILFIDLCVMYLIYRLCVCVCGGGGGAEETHFWWYSSELFSAVLRLLGFLYGDIQHSSIIVLIIDICVRFFIY